MKQSDKKLGGSRLPNETDKAVGIKLRKLRLDADITLQDLASRIGLSHQQLQKYETGANRISAGMLPVLADALGVAIMELFENADRSASAKMTSADKLRGECEILLRRTKSEDALQRMSKVLKALSS